MKLADRLKEEISILDLASHFNIIVGRKNTAICPFHEDTNASLQFYPKTNRFYCFGCAAKGTVIDLAMKMQNSSLSEALSYLVDQYHIKEFNTFQIAKMPSKNINQHKIINQEIYQYFFNNIDLTEKGKEYLLKRGLSDNTITKFRIRSIDDPKKILHKLKQQFDKNDLKKSGLVITSKEEYDYLVFWRPAIIFTHFKDGNPIYFSSRNIVGKVKSFKLAGIKQKYYLGFKNEKNIYIFESVIDGLSNYDLYGDAFISINGINSINIDKYKLLLKAFPDKNFILAFDNDKAGRMKLYELRNGIKEISYLSFLNWDIIFKECNVKDCKDMNEVLMKCARRHN